MGRTIIMAVVLLIQLVTWDCSGIVRPAEADQPLIGGVVLDPETIDRLSIEAFAGSGEAARRIGLHHGMRGERREALYWYTIAAENGDVVGQTNLAFWLKDDSDSRNRQRAVFWLKKAASQGSPLAQERLKQLEGRLK